MSAGKPLSTKALGWFRTVHTWAGLVLGLGVVVMAVTGFWLTHEKALEPLGEVTLRAGRLGPVTHLVADGAFLAAGTEHDVFVSSPERPSLSALSLGRGGEVTALSLTGDRLLVGLEDGLVSCVVGPGTCRDLGAGLPEKAEVRGVLEEADELLVALHHHGVYALRQGRWQLVSQGLEQAAELKDGRAELHVHGLVRAGGAVVVATSRGLFEVGDGVRLVGLEGRRVEGVAVDSRGRLVATHKDDPRPWRLESGVFAPIDLPEAPPVATAGLLRARDEKKPTRLQATRPLTAIVAGGLVSLDEARWLHSDATAAVTVGDAVVVATTAGLWRGGLVEPLPKGAGAGLTLGKVMKDLHTGKLFGDRLWLVYDAISLALVMFVGTGVYLYLWPLVLRRRKQRQHGSPRTA
jgi:hypothetical protein